jgi:hypothetical protein
MFNCFNIDQGIEHELALSQIPESPFRIRCTKKIELCFITELLDINPDLWIIFMLRDPRDSIVSRHKKAPNVYWTNLRQWRENMRAAKILQNHPRFIQLRYEDLVTDPNRAQAALLAKMPFLQARHRFSEFHRQANPSKESLDALGGLRPISPNSIGSWRKHKPRLLAQMQIHGSLVDDLIALGYESDDAWLKELDGVVPDNQTSRQSEISSLKRQLKRAYKRWRYPKIYARNLAKMRRHWPDRIK